MTRIIFIGLGGFIGAILRYLTDMGVKKMFPDLNFPVGIFVCNILGCFLIGLLASLFVDAAISENLKAKILIGFLGSYTTFSTFSKNSLDLFMNNQYVPALLNIFLSVGVGIIFVFLGMMLAKQIA